MAIPSAQIVATSGQSASVISRSRARSLIPENEDRPPRLSGRGVRRPDPTSDFDEVLALVQACDRAVYDDSDWTADELREEWDDLDLGRDAWLAMADGRIVGVMHCHGLQGSRVLLDGYP